jgi:hypothetical protein
MLNLNQLFDGELVRTTALLRRRYSGARQDC